MTLAYRVGIWGWKAVAKAGGRVRLRVRITRDEDADVYIARSPDLDGLICEAKTLDELKEETLRCADALLELQLEGRHPLASTEFHLSSPVPHGA